MSCCSDLMKPVEVSSMLYAAKTRQAHAARAMRDSGCGCAPVVKDTENLELVGVVTERDVCCGVAAEDRRASESSRGTESCVPCLRVVMQMSQLKLRARNSTNIARRACRLPTMRAAAAGLSASTVWIADSNFRDLDRTCGNVFVCGGCSKEFIVVIALGVTRSSRLNIRRSNCERTCD